GVGGIVARSLAAEPLYLRLSSDFADLGKMIAKLAREQDREWFIHVAPVETAAALIHLQGGGCRVIRPEGDAIGEEMDSPDPSTNAALRDLVSECNQAACAFDVFFRRIAESAEPEIAPVQTNTASAATDKSHPLVEDYSSRAAAAVAAVQPVAAAAEAEAAEAFRPEPVVAEEPLSAQYESSATGSAGEEEIGDATVREPEAAWTQPPQELPHDSSAESRQDDFSPALSEDAIRNPEWERAEEGQQMEPPFSTRRWMNTGDLRGDSEGEAMADVKRLMGEIARTIEEATRAIEQRDRFAINLREGQLKVADRYPFLDPFGAEFEYLAGEIVFVGKAHPAEFIAGLTEALKYAVTSTALASAQPARLRARIAEDLRDLLERNRAEFEQFGLDHALEQIIGA
ncbi:MAG TPA: hypothetical protein VNO70_26235, partial [Blastocatellia bacterium]|nr:hypothetical protein [Blastocatellia bacterium]